MPLPDTTSFPIWMNGAIFALAAAVIFVSGRRLTRNLDAIALKTRLDHAFVGMLLLGGITSLPEVANTVNSASIGSPELGLNNLLGSAAINVLLLAIVDEFVGRKAVTSIVAHASTMMMASLCMIVLVIIAAAITVEDVRVGPVGIGSLVIGAASIFSFWLASGFAARSPWALAGVRGQRESPAREDTPESALSALWMRVAIDGALIFAAGYALSQTGDSIATQAGLTSAAVGFGLIGTATSLPELVTIYAALRLGRPEMAFGQVLGTNFVNLSLFPLSDLFYTGEPVLNLLGSFEVIAALLGAIVIGIFLVGLLEHRDRTVHRMGWDSAVVVAVFAVGIVILATL